MLRSREVSQEPSGHPNYLLCEAQQAATVAPVGSAEMQW
jgi:hypothetical protein